MTEWGISAPLLADGPVGDWLAARQLAAGQPPAALNATRPDAVSAGHRAHVQAGARLLRTNTRDASAPVLAWHGLSGRCEAIHNSATAVARQAGGGSLTVAGVLTPIPESGPRGLPASERERAYSEQLIYLSDTGVDLFILEHFASVEELERVTHLAGRVSDAPVLALLRLPGQQSPSGVDLREAGVRLLKAGAQALGLSCAAWGEWAAEHLEALRSLGVPVALTLNAEAGSATSVPLQFAECLAAASDSGASIVGGCCGAMPGHIRAAAGRLRLLQPREPGA